MWGSCFFPSRAEGPLGQESRARRIRGIMAEIVHRITAEANIVTSLSEEPNF